MQNRLNGEFDDVAAFARGIESMAQAGGYSLSGNLDARRSTQVRREEESDARLFIQQLNTKALNGSESSSTTAGLRLETSRYPAQAPSVALQQTHLDGILHRLTRAFKAVWQNKDHKSQNSGSVPFTLRPNDRLKVVGQVTVERALHEHANQLNREHAKNGKTTLIPDISGTPYLSDQELAACIELHGTNAAEALKCLNRSPSPLSDDFLELLTGNTPFDTLTIKTADELRRLPTDAPHVKQLLLVALQARPGLADTYCIGNNTECIDTAIGTGLDTEASRSAQSGLFNGTMMFPRGLTQEFGAQAPMGQFAQRVVAFMPKQS